MIGAAMEEEPKRNGFFMRYLNKKSYDALPDQEKKRLHEAWRADPAITAKHIMEVLELHSHAYYTELDRLGVAYTKKPQYKRKQKLASAKKPESSCAISFKGVCNPQQLLDQLQRLELMINESAEAYDFEIKLQEKQEN